MKKENMNENMSVVIAVIMFALLFFILLPKNGESQPKYDIFEEKQWIIYLPDDSIFFYDIVEDENGKLLFYIEAGSEHSGYCYLETNSMVLDGASIQYQVQYREMFDLLFRYYEDRLFLLTEIITYSSGL